MSTTVGLSGMPTAAVPPGLSPWRQPHQQPDVVPDAPRTRSVGFACLRQSISLSLCESSPTSVARLHPPPARMRRTAQTSSRSRRTVRSRCLASASTATVMSTSSASRTDDTVAWYVYLCERMRKIPIRLRMSEQQKDGGGACVRAMERSSRANV